MVSRRTLTVAFQVAVILAVARYVVARFAPEPIKRVGAFL